MADLQVSDHALIRWLERVHGIDMEGFREMLRQDVARMIGTIVPATEFTVILGDRTRIAVKGGTVVTVIDSPKSKLWGRAKARANETAIPALGQE